MRPPVLPGLFTVPVEQMAGPDFDGVTYQHERDHERLNSQLQRVAMVLRREMGNACWLTLEEISAITGDPVQSVSARIRDLRKPKFGGWEIEHRLRDGHAGLWEYRRRV